VIYARDPDGIWHMVSATHPAAADTVCGRTKMEAHLFATHPEAFGVRKWETCRRCRMAALKARETFETVNLRLTLWRDPKATDEEIPVELEIDARLDVRSYPVGEESARTRWEVEGGGHGGAGSTKTEAIAEWIKERLTAKL
jgi:hypothetical protein